MAYDPFCQAIIYDTTTSTNRSVSPVYRLFVERSLTMYTTVELAFIKANQYDLSYRKFLNFSFSFSTVFHRFAYVESNAEVRYTMCIKKFGTRTSCRITLTKIKHHE